MGGSRVPILLTRSDFLRVCVFYRWPSFEERMDMASPSARILLWGFRQLTQASFPHVCLRTFSSTSQLRHYITWNNYIALSLELNWSRLYDLSFRWLLSFLHMFFSVLVKNLIVILLVSLSEVFNFYLHRCQQLISSFNNIDDMNLAQNWNTLIHMLSMESKQMDELPLN